MQPTVGHEIVDHLLDKRERRRLLHFASTMVSVTTVLPSANLHLPLHAPPPLFARLRQR
jgi:hypothetical protein